MIPMVKTKKGRLNLDLASDVGWAKVGKIKSHLWDFLGGILVKFDEKCGKIWFKSHVKIPLKCGTF